MHVLRHQTGSHLDLHLHSVDDDGDVPIRVDDAAKALRDPSGRYQVLGEIGRGGVGIVYKGRDQDLGRDVAMKVLRPEYADRPEIVERFVEEAQIGGQLQHPGIVPVYEIGMQAGARPYFAMKLVKGETLAVRLARRQQPFDDRRRFLAIFEQVCQTIAYAHARHVVHRDLKPANVMVGAFGEVQVVDWGFAKVLPRAGAPTAPPLEGRGSTIIETVRSAPRARAASESELGSTMGTPAYMPPEQALGHIDQVDERSDVFGLGAILCEILTGAPPYLERDGDVMRQAARCDLGPALARLAACGADAVLVDLCRRCLAGPRSERPASGREVADAIAAHSTSVEERAQQAIVHAAEARGRVRSTVWLAAAALALVTCGGSAFVLLQQQAQVRRIEVDARIAAAVATAEQCLGTARSGTGGRVAAWLQALDAARQVEVLAEGTEASPAHRAKAAALLAAARTGHTEANTLAVRAEQHRTMLERLLAVRAAQEPLLARAATLARGSAELQGIVDRIDAEYGRGFAACLGGKDVTALPIGAAVAELQGDHAVDIAAVLDDWRLWPLRLGGERVGRTELANRLLAVAMDLDPEPWRNRLRTLTGKPTVGRADLDALRRDVDLATLPPASLALLARAFAAVAAADTALAVLVDACDRHPDAFGCFVDLGRLAAPRDPARAVACLLAARAVRPGSAVVHHQLGALRQGLGDLDGALASFRRAVELAPDLALGHTGLGELLDAMGRHAEAETCHRRALALDPLHADAHDRLGRCLAYLGRPAEAIAAFRQALGLFEPFADAWRNLGDALRTTGELDAATTACRRALALAPGAANGHTALALALARLGRTDDAEHELSAALANDPEFAPAHFHLGIALQARGRLGDALRSLQQAAAIWSTANDVDGRTWLPRARERIQQVESALGGRR
ncbi:MAG: tetratricopeptide repeat protein [Planctomycetes bacterium]|nr:tetratricopeptide repeat protein [Planctomycetota bacterium]